MTTEKPKRKGRAIVDDDTLVLRSPKTAVEMAEHSLTLRRLAKVMYVSDPHERSVEWHWEHDRDLNGNIIFKGNVPVGTYVTWATEDQWRPAREEFWSHVEVSVLTNLRDEFTKQKIEELRILNETRGYLTEYLLPLKNKDGTVRRHPETHPRYAGLPVFPLDFGKVDRFIEAYLKIDERMMLKRGEAIMRTQSELEDIHSERATSEGSDRLGPARDLAKKVNFSPDELRTLARRALEERQRLVHEKNAVPTVEVIDVGEEPEEEDEL